MKYLFFTATVMVSILTQAYLVKGFRTTVLIEGIGSNDMKEISIEGCDKESCSKPDYKAKCTKESPSKFYCYFKEQYPFFIRFVVKISGSKTLSSKFFPTNGESSLNNFKLNILENAVNAEAIKDVL